MALRETDQIPVRITQPGAVEEILPRVGASQALPAGQVKPATMGELRAILGLPADADDSIIAAGTYLPTITDGANVTATVAQTSRFWRIGNVVGVNGAVSIDPNSAATATTIGISLPIASDMGSAIQLSGQLMQVINVSPGPVFSAIVGDSANDRATTTFISSSGSGLLALQYTFTFTYEVV